jgi:very-short-patch-repair endonuclease
MLERAKMLRREMTPQERILWRHVRDRRLEGAKIRRQMWLAGFVADFACPEARLVVEADGSQHADRAGYDAARAAAFARLGWRTLRFWNNEIDKNLDEVLTAIRAALMDSYCRRGETHVPSPGQPAADHPLPCREREG